MAARADAVELDVDQPRPSITLDPSLVQESNVDDPLPLPPPAYPTPTPVAHTTISASSTTALLQPAMDAQPEVQRVFAFRLNTCMLSLHIFHAFTLID